MEQWLRAWEKEGDLANPTLDKTRRVISLVRLNSKQPRVANILVEDHLRPATVKACILLSHPDIHGRIVDADPRRFGFDNLRHGLASSLIRSHPDCPSKKAPLVRAGPSIWAGMAMTIRDT